MPDVPLTPRLCEISIWARQASVYQPSVCIYWLLPRRSCGGFAKEFWSLVNLPFSWSSRRSNPCAQRTSCSAARIYYWSDPRFWWTTFLLVAGVYIPRRKTVIFHIMLCFISGMHFTSKFVISYLPIYHISSSVFDIQKIGRFQPSNFPHHNFECFRKCETSINWFFFFETS